MNEIGIRDLKAHASKLVRNVAEHHATYTVTCRGRAVGILAPTDFAAPPAPGKAAEAWARLESLADRLAAGRRGKKSALKALSEMRR